MRIKRNNWKPGRVQLSAFGNGAHRRPKGCEAACALDAPLLPAHEKGTDAAQPCWDCPSHFWSIPLVAALTHLESVRFSAPLLSCSQYTIWRGHLWFQLESPHVLFASMQAQQCASFQPWQTLTSRNVVKVQKQPASKLLNAPPKSVSYERSGIVVVTYSELNFLSGNSFQQSAGGFGGGWGDVCWVLKDFMSIKYPSLNLLIPQIFRSADHKRRNTDCFFSAD